MRSCFLINLYQNLFFMKQYKIGVMEITADWNVLSLCKTVSKYPGEDTDITPTWSHEKNRHLKPEVTSFFFHLSFVSVILSGVCLNQVFKKKIVCACMCKCVFMRCVHERMTLWQSHFVVYLYLGLGDWTLVTRLVW